jgi:hypothetical protein
MTRNVPKQVAAAFATYPPEVEALALRARTLLLNTLPDVMEVLDSTRKVVGYCYGPGYKGVVCTLILSKKGVKVGIVRGADLPDPHGLMSGDGIYHRHVELRSNQDLEQRGLKPLLLTALEAWHSRNAAGAKPKARTQAAKRSASRKS